MIYQTAQEIGKKAVTLKGDVNAIILTGGIAHSKYVTDMIRDYVSSIAPVTISDGAGRATRSPSGASSSAHAA